jgi:hypothetical protein
MSGWEEAGKQKQGSASCGRRCSRWRVFRMPSAVHNSANEKENRFFEKLEGIRSAAIWIFEVLFGVEGTEQQLKEMVEAENRRSNPPV